MRNIGFTLLIVSFIMVSIASIPQISEYGKSEYAIGDEFNITDDLNSQGKPAIYENFVVWNENVIENNVSNWEIFLYDLSMDSDGDGIPNYLDPDTGPSDPAKIRITNNRSNQLEPEIYGDKIVWEDERHGNFDIFMYDLSEDSDDDTIPNYLDPDDDGDLILDVDDEDADPAEIQITDNPAHQEKPSIYGNKIVWVDKRYGNTDIFIYDLISGKETVVIGHNETGEPRYRPKQNYPKIYGNNIVWQDDRFVNYEIFLYDLSVDSDFDGTPNYLDSDRPQIDEAEIRVTSSSEFDYKPDIYQNKIAYVRSDNIYVYNIDTGLEYKVTNSNSTQKISNRPCDFQGTKIVWTYDTGSKDIFYYDLAVDSDDNDIPNYMEPVRLDPDPALFQVTNQSLTQIMLPAIYADKIVWQDSRNTSKPADLDIYIFSLTDNKAPVIKYPIPNYDPEITEGDSYTFMIVADDPEGQPLFYTWYMDNELIIENDTFSLVFLSDIGMAGAHEIKVVISDEKNLLEKIWVLNIKESGVKPLEITLVEPCYNPTILEGEEITLKLKARYLGSKHLITNWEYQNWIFPPPNLVFQEEDSKTVAKEVLMQAKVTSQLDYNGTNFQKIQKVYANISDGTNSISYMWDITVLFLNDTDFDGYSDEMEVNWNTDPHNPLATPPDLDHDLVVDLDDNDIDGDGTLAEYDSDDTNPNVQAQGNPDSLPEILIMLISVMLLVIALIAYSRVQRP